MTSERAVEPREFLHWFGHDYEVDGRQEWHSLNCIYRKTWPMGGEDEPGCVAVRDYLAAARGEPPEPGPAIDVRTLADAITGSAAHFWVPFGATAYMLAEVIAAEYDRLRP